MDDNFITAKLKEVITDATNIHHIYIKDLSYRVQSTRKKSFNIQLLASEIRFFETKICLKITLYVP